MSTRNKFPLKKFRLLCIPAALSVLAGLPIAGQAQTLSTLAGSGVNGTGMSPVASAQAQFSGVTSILRTPYGGFFATEFNTNRIRWIGDDGTTTIAAGNGAGFVDNVPLSQAKFNGPNAIIMAPDGSIVIFDATNNRIRRMSGNDQMVTTIIGNGNAGSDGDGGQAIDASLNFPTSGVYGPDGSLYVVEGNGQRIRKITPDGNISTVAGNGTAGFSGDNGEPANAQLNHPRAIAISKDGNLLYVTEQNRVRAINLGANVIVTLAGDGTSGTGGDGGWSNQAQLGGNWTAANGTARTIGALASIAVLSDGRVLVGDRANHKIRQISADYKISTYAGSGVAGYTANGSHNGVNGFYGGGTLSQARFNQPAALHVDSDNNVYFSDFFNFAVRKFTPPPSRYDVAGKRTDISGVEWAHELFVFSKANGCQVTDADEDPDSGLPTLTITGPAATCVAPPMWSGAKLVTDAGPDDMQFIAFEVDRLISKTTNGAAVSYKVVGMPSDLESFVRSGSLAIGTAGQAAIDTALQASAASADATISGEIAVAQSNATPYNAFLRSNYVDQPGLWSPSAKLNGDGLVSGTRLPSDALRMPMERTGVIGSAPQASAFNFNETAFNRQLAGEGRNSQDVLMAFQPFEVGPDQFVAEKFPQLEFFWRQDIGYGFTLTDFKVGLTKIDTNGKPGTSWMSPTTIKQLKEFIVLPEQISSYPYIIGNVGLKVVSATVALKVDGLDTYAVGKGRDDLYNQTLLKKRNDCITEKFNGQYPEYLKLKPEDGLEGYPSRLALVRRHNGDVKAQRAEYLTKNLRWVCGSTNSALRYWLRLDTSATLNSSFEIEHGREAPFSFTIGGVPVWGTVTGGMWIGAGVKGAIKSEIGYENMMTLQAPLGKPRTFTTNKAIPYPKGFVNKFGVGNDLAVFAYLQPFLMASVGKIYVKPGDTSGISDIAKKLFNWDIDKVAVLKNGLFRVSVNLKADARITGKQVVKNQKPTIDFKSCASMGARLDILKGVIGDGQQLQFSTAVGEICTTPVVIARGISTVQTASLPGGAIALNSFGSMDNTETEDPAGTGVAD